MIVELLIINGVIMKRFIFGISIGLYSVIGMLFANKRVCDFNMLLQHPERKIAPIVVVGGGPAGLSAALYAANDRVHTVLFTGPQIGGQLASAGEVENMPNVTKQWGHKIIENLEQQAHHAGAIIVYDSVTVIEPECDYYRIITESGTVVYAYAVIVATGGHARTLGVPGEQKYWSVGVSTCALCDRAFFEGKEVAVIGGGDAAVEEAMQLAPYAKNVTIFVRGAQMRAAPRNQEKLKDYSNIFLCYSMRVIEVLGDGTKMTGLQLEDTKTGEKQEVKMDGMFLAIGHDANNDLVANLIELDAEGYIILPDRTQQTTRAGIFAAGDNADKRYRQAIVAEGHGSMAAMDAMKYLREVGFTERISKLFEAQYYKGN